MTNDHPHRMHLKGPWEYEWLQRQPAPEGRDTADSGRVKMPVEWRSAFGESPGHIRFRRRFGRPTNLDLRERVFVVFDGVGGEARVCLGRKELGLVPRERSEARFDVTDLLEARNELVVDVAFDPQRSPDSPGGLYGPVALEIVETGNRD